MVKMLSVVVPTFNEEDVIGECLDRLLPQIEHIHEIIVVDNNSTDKTADIVATYVDRFTEVRTISESRQGLVYARNAGLDAATGDALARIDSDTMVGPQWASNIVEFLTEDHAGHWSALCGRGEAYGLPYGDLIDRLKNRMTFVPFISRRSATREDVRGVFVLYGSNMVLRRATWLAIRESVSMRRDIFEDVDMGLCVTETGGRNAFLPYLTVGVSPRRMESSVSAFVRYMSFLPRTFALHRRWWLALGSATVYVPWVTLAHIFRLVLIRGYDRQTRTFSPRHLLRRTTDRIMP